MNNRRSFIVGLKSTEISSQEQLFLRKYKPWGIILFTRNIKNLNISKFKTKFKLFIAYYIDNVRLIDNF